MNSKAIIYNLLKPIISKIEQEISNIKNRLDFIEKMISEEKGRK